MREFPNHYVAKDISLPCPEYDRQQMVQSGGIPGHQPGRGPGHQTLQVPH